MKPWREYRGPRAGEIESWLSRHARHVSRESNKDGTTEIRFKPSPCCGHDKRPAALINASSGLWRCNACGQVGNWFTLTRTFGDPLSESDRYRGGDMRIPWAAYGDLRAAKRRLVTGGHYPGLLAYCESRGFSHETLDDWRVTTKGCEILRWPIYAHDGKSWVLVNARMRVATPRARKEAKTADWFEVKGGPTGLCVGNHLLGWRKAVNNRLDGEGGLSQGSEAGKLRPCLDKRVLVTEGQWDAMSAWELGIGNVLSLPNGAAHLDCASMLRYVPEDWEVWLCIDMDEAGERAVERAFAQLGSERVARIQMPYKDLNEWLTEVPDVTAEQVLGAVVGITRSIQTRSGLVAQTSCGEDAPPPSRWVGFGATVSAGPKVIAELPWPQLSKLLSGGLTGGTTTGLLAPSGRGKTTIANQIAIHAANSGVVTGIISLEGTRASAAEKLVKQGRGWTGLCGDELMTVMSRIMLSPLEGNRTNWRECGREFETMIGEGAQLLILDNLDFCMSRDGGDGNGEKIEALGTMIELARQTGVHIITVWQPRKVDPDLIINSSHQKGFAQAYQDADNYINLNWFGALRRLELEKHRGAGIELGANHVWLVYDRDTGCMIEVDPSQAEAMRDQSGRQAPL